MASTCRVAAALRVICESDLDMSNKSACRLNDDAIQAIKEISSVSA